MPIKDASNRSRAQTITPLSVPRKDDGIDKNRLKRRHQYRIVLLLGVVITLVASGAWLLHYLSENPFYPQQITEKRAAPKAEPPPQKVPEAAAPPQKVPEAAAPSPPAADPEALALDMQTADQKLAEFLEIKNELDGKGAADWGGELYTDMVEISRQADSRLIEKAYKQASADYDRATAIGRQLAGQTEEILGQLLDDGQAALTEGKGAAAQSKFEVALKIDPTNQTAQKGLKRSQNIEAVFKLIETGRQHEKANSLALARTQYQKALQIDPDAHQAREALKRVTGLIKEQQFRQMMSTGLAAFHNNDYALARTRLLKAKSLKPDSREASQALLQVDQALRLARINRLRNTAQKAEQAEDWQTALQSYLAVLEIDKNLQFATSGKERAREQIRIAKRLDFYLTQPRVLESDKQLQNAVLLLEEVKETTPRGRQLTSRIVELQKLVDLAQTEVMITIESDNLTQIAVYKVGKLGRFMQYELKLRPGTYVVVGARDGYQDVRRKINVKPGQQALRVTVKCKVKI